MEETNSNLCRICLESKASLLIFETDDDCDILSKLTQCLKEKIEDIEGYPRYICNKCNSILDTVYNFINKYRDTCKILESGLVILKQDNSHKSKVYEHAEDEILIENIKYEFIDDTVNSDGEFSDDFLEPLQKIKLEKEDSITTKADSKKLHSTSTNAIQKTNKIASSILEGGFIWNGETWCLNSSNTVIKPPKKFERSDIKKRMKIKIPKIKTNSSNQSRLCDLCGEVLKNQEKLLLHKKKVHFGLPTKFPCQYCGKVFTNKSYLNRHVKGRHEGERSFKCTICDSGFVFKGELTNHHKMVHEKVMKPKKQFKCSICNKSYKCTKSVVIHERSVHTGQRPAICAVCGTSFYHEDYLKEHMRLHTGETPFKCPVCGRGYAQRSNMKSHLRIHRKSELDEETLSKLRPNYLRLLKP